MTQTKLITSATTLKDSHLPIQAILLRHIGNLSFGFDTTGILKSGERGIEVRRKASLDELLFVLVPGVFLLLKMEGYLARFQKGGGLQRNGPVKVRKLNANC